MSNQLSIATVLGLALAALLPLKAPSAAPQASAPAAKRAPAPAGPVEVARASPLPVPHAPAAPDAAEPAEGRAPASILQVVAQRSRDRRSRQQKAESGSFGKAGTIATVEKTPVPPADPKTVAPQVEAPAPDEWSDAEIIAALRDCLKRLAPLGAAIEVAEPLKQERCGTPAPVVLKRVGLGATGVEFQPPPTLNCAMVASLHTWIEKTLQPAAQEMLGSPIARIRNASGYACRNRVGTLFHSDRLSEHALANAIDISAFVTADGRTIDVLSKWGPTVRDLREQQERAAEAVAEAREAAKAADKEAAAAARAVAKVPRGEKREQAKTEAARKKEDAQSKRENADRLETERRKFAVRIAELGKLGRRSDARPIPVRQNSRHRSADEDEGDDASGLAPEALFLRRLHVGACDTFGTVLGPEANEAHRNHFHFDLAARKRRAYCE